MRCLRRAFDLTTQQLLLYQLATCESARALMHDHPLPRHARAIVRTVDRMRVRARVLDHTYHHRNYAHAHFLKHIMRVRHGCFERKFRYYARMCAYALRNSELSAIAPAFTARWLLWTLQTSGEEFSVYICRPAAQTL